MTREEHLKWCKDRAILEFDFYIKEGIELAARNGVVSMMSDLSKHDETRSKTLQALCLLQMGRIKDREDFLHFINGFN